MIKKILVAHDFSACANAALEHARMLARSTGAELVLVHANELPVAPVGDPTLVPAHVYEERVARGEQRMAALVASVQGTTPVRGVSKVGPALDVIADAIAREKPDLVIAGTHGRRRVSRMFLGSLAERLVRTSPVPVLTVRAAEAA